MSPRPLSSAWSSPAVSTLTPPALRPGVLPPHAPRAINVRSHADMPSNSRTGSMIFFFLLLCPSLFGSASFAMFSRARPAPLEPFEDVFSGLVPGLLVERPHTTSPAGGDHDNGDFTHYRRQWTVGNARTVENGQSNSRSRAGTLERILDGLEQELGASGGSSTKTQLPPNRSGGFVVLGSGEEGDPLGQSNKSFKRSGGSLWSGDTNAKSKSGGRTPKTPRDAGTATSTRTPTGCFTRTPTTPTVVSTLMAELLHAEGLRSWALRPDGAVVEQERGAMGRRWPQGLLRSAIREVTADGPEVESQAVGPRSPASGAAVRSSARRTEHQQLLSAPQPETELLPEDESSNRDGALAETADIGMLRREELHARSLMGAEEQDAGGACEVPAAAALLPHQPPGASSSGARGPHEEDPRRRPQQRRPEHVPLLRLPLPGATATLPDQQEPFGDDDVFPPRAITPRRPAGSPSSARPRAPSHGRRNNIGVRNNVVTGRGPSWGPPPPSIDAAQPAAFLERTLRPASTQRDRGSTPAPPSTPRNFLDFLGSSATSARTMQTRPPTTGDNPGRIAPEPARRRPVLTRSSRPDTTQGTPRTIRSTLLQQFPRLPFRRRSSGGAGRSSEQRDGHRASVVGAQSAQSAQSARQERPPSTQALATAAAAHARERRAHARDRGVVGRSVVGSGGIMSPPGAVSPSEDGGSTPGSGGLDLEDNSLDGHGLEDNSLDTTFLPHELADRPNWRTGQRGSSSSQGSQGPPGPAGGFVPVVAHNDYNNWCGSSARTSQGVGLRDPTPRARGSRFEWRGGGFEWRRGRGSGVSRSSTTSTSNSGRDSRSVGEQQGVPWLGI